MLLLEPYVSERQRATKLPLTIEVEVQQRLRQKKLSTTGIDAVYFAILTSRKGIWPKMPNGSQEVA